MSREQDQLDDDAEALLAEALADVDTDQIAEPLVRRALATMVISGLDREAKSVAA